LVERVISQVKFEIGQLEKLVTPLAEIWERTKSELQLFLDGLNKSLENK